MELITKWTSVLELNSAQKVTAGSEKALSDAIRRGADLRIYTEFRHNEHIDLQSKSNELVKEVSEFAVTYLLDNRWTAGAMSLRQPVDLPDRFGPRPSMSFFVYNQNGQQAIARPFLDGKPAAGQPGASPIDKPEGMAKYLAQSTWDGQTNAPSTNFIYEFESFKYCVWDGWREVLSHDEHGAVKSGSIDTFMDAFTRGCEMKVGIRGACADLGDGAKVDHELFVRCGPGYYYVDQKLFIAETHPLVRVKPAIPMIYGSRGWDFGWFLPRTDGQVAFRRCDPYTLKFNDVLGKRYALRWFVR